MMSYESYQRTIHEVGFYVLKALLVLNTLGVFLVLASMLHPQVAPLGVQAAWPLFVLGIIASFASFLATYLAAQIGLNGGTIGVVWLIVLIIGPALALLMFCQGVSGLLGGAA